MVFCHFFENGIHHLSWLATFCQPGQETGRPFPPHNNCIFSKYVKGLYTICILSLQFNNVCCVILELMAVTLFCAGGDDPDICAIVNLHICIAFNSLFNLCVVKHSLGITWHSLIEDLDLSIYEEEESNHLNALHVFNLHLTVLYLCIPCMLRVFITYSNGMRTRACVMPIRLT